MIVLHAGLVDGRFLLWGESPRSEPVQAISRRNRKTRSVPPQPQPLPFDAGASQLARVLHDFLPGALRRSSQIENAVVWLPTVREQPLPSSSLIAEPPQTNAMPVVTPWTVTALHLAPEQAIDLLGACLDRDTLAPGVILGSTLSFWSTALRFAGAVVAREQFLPAVEQQEGSWRACWKPALTGAEGLRFNQLAQAMPAGCRALSANAKAAPS